MLSTSRAPSLSNQTSHFPRANHVQPAGIPVVPAGGCTASVPTVLFLFCCLPILQRTSTHSDHQTAALFDLRPRCNYSHSTSLLVRDNWLAMTLRRFFGFEQICSGISLTSKRLLKAKETDGDPSTIQSAAKSYAL